MEDADDDDNLALGPIVDDVFANLAGA